MHPHRQCSRPSSQSAPDALTLHARMQVLEVLRQMPNCDELSEAISFDGLGPDEISTLGRVLR